MNGAGCFRSRITQLRTAARPLSRACPPRAVCLSQGQAQGFILCAFNILSNLQERVWPQGVPFRCHFLWHRHPPHPGHCPDLRLKPVFTWSQSSGFPTLPSGSSLTRGPRVAPPTAPPDLPSGSATSTPWPHCTSSPWWARLSLDLAFLENAAREAGRPHHRALEVHARTNRSTVTNR